MWTLEQVQTILSSFWELQTTELTILTFSLLDPQLWESELGPSTAFCILIQPLLPPNSFLINRFASIVPIIYACYCNTTPLSRHTCTDLCHGILQVNNMRSSRTLIVLILALCAISTRAQDPAANNQQQGSLLNYLQSELQLFSQHMLHASVDQTLCYYPFTPF